MLIFVWEFAPETPDLENLTSDGPQLGFSKRNSSSFKKSGNFRSKWGLIFFYLQKKTACIGFSLMYRFCENLIKISPVSFVLDLGSDNDISKDRHCP